MKPLIDPRSLLQSSWETYVKTWDMMMKYIAVYVLAGVLVGASLIMKPGNNNVAGFAFFLMCIAYGIVVVWTSACMYQVALANETGVKTTEEQVNKRGWALILSFLWIGILNMFASFGAFLLLVLPGIYVAVRLGFGTISLIDKDVKGRAALASSWALTKDRFWAIFGRQLLGGIVFGIGISIVSMAAILIIGLVAGQAKIDILISPAGQDPVKNGINLMFNSVVQGAFIPLALIFQAKLYRSLLQTKE
jgi:hypothetical protein